MKLSSWLPLNRSGSRFAGGRLNVDNSAAYAANHADHLGRVPLEILVSTRQKRFRRRPRREKMVTDPCRGLDFVLLDGGLDNLTARSFAEFGTRRTARFDRVH